MDWGTFLTQLGLPGLAILALVYDRKTLIDDLKSERAAVLSLHQELRAQEARRTDDLRQSITAERDNIAILGKAIEAIGGRRA